MSGLPRSFPHCCKDRATIIRVASPESRWFSNNGGRRVARAWAIAKLRDYWMPVARVQQQLTTVIRISNKWSIIPSAEGAFLWSSSPHNVYLAAVASKFLPQPPLAIGSDRRASDQLACIDPSRQNSIARFSINCQPDKVCDRDNVAAAWG